MLDVGAPNSSMKPPPIDAWVHGVFGARRGAGRVARLARGLSRSRWAAPAKYSEVLFVRQLCCGHNGSEIPNDIKEREHMGRRINVGTSVVLVVSTPLVSGSLPTPASTPSLASTATPPLETAPAAVGRLSVEDPIAVPSIQSTGVINDTLVLHLAPLITDIDFAALQQRDKIIMLEHTAELYSAYFPAPNVGEEWGDFFDTLTEAFIWTATSAYSGILGNLAYDILKGALKRRIEAANAERRNYWETLHRDYEQVLEVVLESVQQSKGIRVQEIMERTSIADKDKVKCWLKVMGGRHTHAGPEACTYRFARTSS